MPHAPKAFGQIMITLKALDLSLSLFPTREACDGSTGTVKQGTHPAGSDWWGQSELGRSQWGGGDSHSGGGVR